MTGGQVRYSSAELPPEGGAPGALPVPRWWRGPDPDPELVRRLFAAHGRSESEIAVLLAVSRERVVAALVGLGLERGARPRHGCFLDVDGLRRLLEQGETVGGLAGRFGVSWDTAGRQLADAGLLPADPAIDPSGAGPDRGPGSR